MFPVPLHPPHQAYSHNTLREYSIVFKLIGLFFILSVCSQGFRKQMQSMDDTYIKLLQNEAVAATPVLTLVKLTDECDFSPTYAFQTTVLHQCLEVCCFVHLSMLKPRMK